MFHASLGLVAFCGLAGWLSLAAPANAEAARGEILSEGCAACHGPAGNSAGAIPSISGLSGAEIVAAFQAYRTDARPATVMNRIARGYDSAEIAAIASYFETLGRGPAQVRP